MKALVHAGLPIVALIAFIALGVASWTLWDENQRLRAELAAFDVRLNKIAAECDQERLSLKRVTEAKESLGRSLVSAMQALDEAKRSLAGLQEDKKRVDAELATERRLAREKAEAEAKAAAERAASAARAAKSEAARRRAEAERRRAEDPLADVGTLKQLLDLTDKAPRRAD